MADFNKALDYHQKATQELKRLGGKEFMVTLQVHAGLGNLALGNVEVARTASQEALRLLKENTGTQVGLDDQAGIFQLLGQLAQHEEQHARAGYYYQRAIDLLQKSNRPLPAARTMLKVVELLIVENNKLEAKKWLQQADIVFHKYNSTHEFAMVEALRKELVD